MKTFLILAVAVLMLCQSSGVLAVADGPDYYRVRNVRSDDVLNIRAAPSMKGKVIGTIPHDGGGIENLGDTVPPLVSDMSAPVWCKIRYRGIEGWVGCKFLGEDGG